MAPSAAMDVVNDLVEMTGDLVWFTHAGNGENSAAHALVRTFPAACDKRNRNDWMLDRLREKWNDIADKLPDPDLASALKDASPSRFDGKTVALWFPARNGRSRLKVSRNLQEVGRVLGNAINTKVRVVIG